MIQMVTVFKRSIRKSGGTAAITVPPVLIENLGWKIGQEVKIYQDDGRLIIEKA
jgi:antitoxin component of MazEF toxin-antitoxin module